MHHFLPCLVLLMIGLGWAAPAKSADREARCAGLPDVMVVSADADQVEVVCAASEQALSYLAHMNLRPRRDIVIELTANKIIYHGMAAYGRYDSRSDRIELMTYTAIRQKLSQPMMYGEPFDQVHYTGAIAHEISHAVMQHNLKTELIGPAPQEYLAHAIQMAVLPEARREKILKRLNVAAWESGDAISDVYLGIEPDKFAAKSYQHLTMLADPAVFVDVLLNAKWFYVYVP